MLRFLGVGASALAIGALMLSTGPAYSAAGDIEEKPKTYKPPTKAEIDQAKKVGKYQVFVKTSRGRFMLELDGKAAPLHVANFVKLANATFYDGLIFHRVEPGFVVQTGDPKGNGTGGPGYTIKAERSPLRHDAGAVGMARTKDPDSAGSQWYITLAPTHFLDQGGRQPGYVVFGKVVQGMDVVKKIKKGDRIVRVFAKPKPKPKPAK
jgi:peptidyl-prolyl cis-trans isomerase B (cyclophilin B)